MGEEEEKGVSECGVIHRGSERGVVRAEGND